MLRSSNRYSKRLLIGAATIAMSVAMSGTASADLFDVQESNYSTAANLVDDAEEIHGNYVEILTITSFDAITGAGTFETLAYWSAGNFVDEFGVNIAAFEGGPGQYELYALFGAEGTFQRTGSEFEFTATGGAIELYADDDQDTSVGQGDLPATGILGAVDILQPIRDARGGTTADDDLLATASLLSGDGDTSGGQSAGNFGLTFDVFALTAAGMGYFVAPIPFYMTVMLEGNFDDFDENLANQILQGSGNANFVPEPAVLSLLGIGLLGSAFALRRRRKVS